MKRNILRFTLLTFAMIWAISGMFRLGGGQYASLAGTLMASACMLVPALSAIIMQAIKGEPVFKGLGLALKINRWWFVGWLIMPIINTIIVGVCALLPGMEFSTKTEILNTALSQMNTGNIHIGAGGLYGIEILSGLFAGCTINAVFALGEELGWRGYLLNQFKGTNFMLTCLTIGVIWGFWHAPLILMGHNFPDHPVAGVFMMVLMCITLTPIITYIRIKAKSVVAAAIVHGTLNATCGLALIYTENYNDLLGIAGVAGITVFLLTDIILFLVDRYGTNERIFTSQV